MTCTIAFLRALSRLKKVDLPTLGRPTSASTGSRRGRSPGGCISRASAILQPQLRQRVRVLGPARVHADEKLEENLAAEQPLELLPRLGTDLLQHRPFFPDEDRLVRRALDVDGRLDDDEIFFLFLGELVDR